MRWLIARARDHEDGAVAVIVALTIVVLVGMAAMVIDVGQLYQERRELQNGADFAALVVAKDCGMGNCGDTTGTATTYADDNANDNTSAVDGVTVDLDARTAKVDTSTSDPSGGSRITYKFAQVLGFNGDKVRASATAQWGPVATAPSLPLTISECEWNRGTGNDPTNLPSAKATFSFHDGNNAEPCNPGGSGSDVPGGFGWLDAENCSATASVRNGAVWVGSSPGNSPPQSCDPSNFPLGTPLLFPVFDDTSGTGQGAQFRIIGYAAFELSGYQLHNGNNSWSNGEACSVPNNIEPAAFVRPVIEAAPGGNGKKPTTTTAPTTTTTAPTTTTTAPENGAGSDQVCITGRFVKFFKANAQMGGPEIPNLGVTTAKLIA